MKEGADVAKSYVNSVNEDGASALHYAAEVVNAEKCALLANREVVKLLLENGIDVTLATKGVRYINRYVCIKPGLHLNANRMRTQKQYAKTKRLFNLPVTVSLSDRPGHFFQSGF